MKNTRTLTPRTAYKATLGAMLLSMWQNRELIWQMTKREVVGRYRGSVMGLAWSFFNPILMLAVYTFVFSVVFKARWGVGEDQSKADFALLLFVGMIVHGLFAECINRAPESIVSNVNYVKKVVFPLEILPIVALGSSAFHSFVSVCVLLAAMLILDGAVPWTALYFPIVLLPLIVGTMGVAWFLAAMSVYLRDVKQTTSVLTTVLLFLSPVFYPISMMPDHFQFWMHLNPLTFIIEESRNMLIWGRSFDILGWGAYALSSMVIAWLGFWWFQRARKGFSDVL